MGEQTYRVRSRRWPTTTGDWKTEESRCSSFGRFSGPVRSEQEGLRLSGPAERKQLYRCSDGDCDENFRKLSQFNEALPRGESTAVKFQWDYILGGNPVYGNRDSETKFVGGDATDSIRISTEKEYQGEGSSCLGLVPKSVSVENGGVRTYTLCSSGFNFTRSYGYNDSSQSSRRYLLGPQKNEDPQFGGHPHSDNPPARVSCKEGEKPIYGSTDTSSFTTPTSDNQNTVTASPINLQLRFVENGMTESREMPPEPSGHVGYGRKSRVAFSANSEMPTNESVNYRRAQLSPMEDVLELNGHNVYNDAPSVRVGAHSLPSEFPYQNTSSVRVRARRSACDSLVDIVDGSDIYMTDISRHTMTSDHQSIEKAYFDVTRASLAMEQDGYRSACLRNGEVYFNHENMQSDEDYDHALQRDGGPRPYEYILELSESKQHGGLYENEGRRPKMLIPGILGAEDPYHRMVKRKRLDEEMVMTVLNPETTSSANDDAFDEIQGPNFGDGQWSDQYTYLGVEYSQDTRTGSTHDESINDNKVHSDDWLSSQNFPISMQGRLMKPFKPSRRDIKKRLGPAQRLRITPRVKMLKQKRPLGKGATRFGADLQVRHGDVHEVNATYEKPKPENSEEFKQLVHSAFLKFVKVLYESPAQSRKYLEQGRIGTLKCIVCGSKSREFVDTLGLVMHTFTSKVGLRAQHLGFHKALCLVMGWNKNVAPNHPWVREVLPDAEALALKEDLIIWPPVFVMHNGSITNTCPEERFIVSIEELRAFLEGMGFGGISKLCRGKPANQSIMVVCFYGIFSGLREAERLHKFYMERKQGRAEFQQKHCRSMNNSNVNTQKESAYSIENVLFGYLGIAGDLDKLDFEMKKRSVVKSRKEIQAIADANLKTEK